MARRSHDRDTQELMEKCHPLGMFDSMATLSVATSPSELYRMVLVDTPIGPYFGDCLSLDDLDEMNIEIIRNTLYKACCHHCGRLPARTATPARPPIRIALESRSRE